MVSELPWNAQTGTLRRELAEGMIDPASKYALEAALQLKERHGGHITCITMGPPMAEEVLYEAAALGADHGVLLTDARMAGADTFITAFILAQAIKDQRPDFDLVLCGYQTSDSETAQVGPQLSEELDIPGVSGVDRLHLTEAGVQMQRVVDDYLETLELDLPGLVTVAPHQYTPRYATLSGMQRAFEQPSISRLNADNLGLCPQVNALKDSPTKIAKVYSPTADKDNIVLKGAAKRVVEELFQQFGPRISGAMGKDLQTHDHEEGR